MGECKNTDINTINLIKNRLMDNESVRIFEKRLKWFETGDRKYLLEMIEGLPQLAIWKKYVDICNTISDSENSVIVYGACVDFEIFRMIYPEVRFKCFCDRDKNKQKNGWYGVEVISPEVLLEKYIENPIIINAQDYSVEIENFLLDNGVPEKNIYNMGRELAASFGMQYFDNDIVAPVKNEVFVDGGAYDLETSRKFINWCKGDYDYIYSFEPNDESYKMCLKQLENRPVDKITLLNKGLWDSSTVLSFKLGGEGSSIKENDENGTVKIETVSVDEVVGNKKVSFIKFDIEGAEFKGLIGAKNTIIKNKPRLAICIYHKPEDIIEIPEYILSLGPEYKLYIRHYKISFYETVLYAIP